MWLNRKYRIVKDNYAGFEVQSREWWSPFWIECNDGRLSYNTHKTIEDAKEFIEKKKSEKKAIYIE